MMFKDECPECGGDLEVIGGSFSAEGLLLTPDGFAFEDAKQIDTENVRVQCIGCKKVFPIGKLTLD